jgi:hypothetical protein
MSQFAVRQAALLRATASTAGRLGATSFLFPLVLRQAAPGIRNASSIPTIAQPSFWRSLVPKPLRSDQKRAGTKGAARSRGWNPATFFIVIFLLIGSMAIQMISLKKDFEAFIRRSDVRIGLLREVVERIQRGEKVDVEKVLGSGDAQREQMWEDGTYPTG